MVLDLHEKVQPRVSRAFTESAMREVQLFSIIILSLFFLIPEPVNAQEEMPSIFYLGYRLPQKPFYEAELLEIQRPVSKGPPENILRQRLAEKGYDGAIVLGRRRHWNMMGVEHDLITCLPIVYEENAKRLEHIKRVTMNVYEQDSLTETVEVYISKEGIIDSIDGSHTALSQGGSIQPWLFNDKSGSNRYPLRSMRKDNGSLLKWREERRSGDTVVYRLRRNWFDYQDIYLRKQEGQLIPQVVQQREGAADTVQSLFLVDRLKKQVWESSYYEKTYEYHYHYLSMRKQNTYPLISPDELINCPPSTKE